jgi:hypothetical protein
VICIAWCAILAVIFSLPPNELVLWTMLALVTAMFLLWQLRAKRVFRGPTKADEAALKALEAAVGEQRAQG